MPETKIYIGTKIVKAFPMTYGEFVYEKSKGTEKISEDQNKRGYRVEYEDGYVSWSPEDTFQRCYREVTQMEKELMFGPPEAEG